MYKFSFDDQLLIYAQRPDARACASYETWNDKLHRWIKRGSKGIALLNDNGILRYVFDISDTRSLENKPLILWSVNQANEKEFVEMIVDKYGPFEQKLDYGLAVILMSKTIVEDNYQDYYSSLMKYEQKSVLSAFENLEKEVIFKELLTNSIAYQILHRSGIDLDKYFTEDDFYSIRYFDTLDTISQLGIASRDLCEIGMTEISLKSREIMIRTFEENKKTRQNKSEEKERSVSNENNSIQSSWGFPISRLPISSPEAGTTGVQQSLRKVEIQLPQDKSSRSSVSLEGKERAQQSLERDRYTSQAENGYPTASAFALSSRSATAEVKTVGTTSNGQTTSLELYQGVPEVNEKFTAENMLPGDTVKKNFSIKVNHKKEIALYFNTEITQETKNLSDVLQIKVTDLNSGEVLCNGSFAELNEKEFSVLLPQNAQGSTTVNYEIEVSADTSIGNEYQAAALMADFHWFVEDEGSLTPDTDDYLTLGLWLVGFLLCAALLIVVFVMLKRAKGEKKA